MRGVAVIPSFVLTAAALIAVSRAAYGGTVSLSWNPVPDSDVAGYRVYYGTATRVYTQSVDVGKVTQTTLSGLTDCTNYFFAVKAYDTSGNQSTSYSSEIQGWSRPVVTSATPSAAEQGRTLTLTIAGSSFRAGVTAVFSGAGITVGSATVNACGQLTLGVTVASTATVGPSNLTLTNPDGTFGTGTAVFTVQAGLPPAITAVASSGVGSTAATVTWTTNEASDSEVFYRKSGATAYQHTAIDGTLVTSHSARLTGLDPSATYQYYVRSADAAGNAATSSPTQTFSTTASTFTYLRFEAESGTLVVPVRAITGAAGAFGSAYIDTPIGTPNGGALSPAGTATFGVNVPAAGTWYIWVRLYGPDASTDTWYESINGAPRKQIVPSVTGQWQWVAGRSYALTAGLSSLELGGGNAQARADRVLLTNDASFVPTEQPVDDQTPPAGDTALTATGDTAQVTLSWKNSSSADFKQTIIRYRTDGKFPVSPVDGLAVVVKAGTVGSADSFVHTGLTDGATYSYSAFAQDASGNISPAATASAISGNASVPSPVQNLHRKDKP